jgi:rhamnosyltransferase
MISIIVRTKNEERWIGSCLDAIARQTRSDHEVVLVDNNSRDLTVNKALQFGVRLVTIDQFLPGAAINRGIEAASGEIIVCLSGHCIPVNEVWLENLVRGLEDESVAGVYGRQEPLAFTPDLDKRDLLITFGLDPRVQVKDSFFHNANSAFRRSTWERFPFDEDVRNIEDRIWASQVQEAGFKILYEPEASVYHHHGIHHRGDPARCKSIIHILETFGAEETKTASNNIDSSTLNIVAVVPVRKEGLRQVAGKPLYQYAIEHARRSKLIKSVVVSTDAQDVHEKAKQVGADLVLTRTADQSRFDVILEMMMQSSLAAMEERGLIPDVLVMLEPTYPLRDRQLLDRLIRQFVEGGFDTVIPAREEYNSCWMEEDGAYRRVDSGHVARQFKQPFFTGLKGVGCVCSPATVRTGELFGENVGLLKLDVATPMVEVRSDADALVAEALMSSPLFDWSAH